MSDAAAPHRIETLARRLMDARSGRTALDAPPADLIPIDQVEAEAVDDKVAELSGWPVLGWKIGCTSEHAQRLMGTTGPFPGRIYQVLDSGAVLGPDDLAVEPKLEGEFAFTIGTDITPHAAPATAADIAPFVADVRPAIEIVGGRHADFFGTPLTCLIADAGANIGLVLGPPAPLPTPGELAATAARVEVDGTVTGRGTGADVLGGPLTALAWLVSNLAARGITLAAGQVVTTGTATQVAELAPGSTATVTIDGIGSASVSRRA